MKSKEYVQLCDCAFTYFDFFVIFTISNLNECVVYEI